MKNKILLPFLSVPLLLASCQSKGYAGTYSFMMGKSKGSHIGASMVITNEEVRDVDNEVLGKKFSMKIDANLGEAVAQDTDSDMASLYTIIGDGIDVDGFYNIGKNIEKDKKQLKIGFNLASLEEYIGTTFVIESEDLEKIFYSEIDSKSIHLYIPVSLDDLLFQLYWYGIDFYYDSTDTMQLRITEGKETGTHPTKEEIAKINETYPSEHRNSKYRDFHTLSLSLTKE